jgi:hypothetical protein
LAELLTTCTSVAVTARAMRGAKAANTAMQMAKLAAISK